MTITIMALKALASDEAMMMILEYVMLVNPSSRKIRNSLTSTDE
jgi:hypothetical protein